MTDEKKSNETTPESYVEYIGAEIGKTTEAQNRNVLRSKLAETGKTTEAQGPEPRKKSNGIKE